MAYTIYDEHNGVAFGGKQARTGKSISGSMEGIGNGN